MLERSGADVQRERSATKEPLDDEAARALIAAARRVVVARGKKVLPMPADEATLDDLRGPTGNYRAPMLRVGTTLLVGYHAELLDSLL